MIEVTIDMDPQDLTHLPPLTTTDVREFIESFGLQVGLIRLQVRGRQ